MRPGIGAERHRQASINFPLASTRCADRDGELRSRLGSSCADQVCARSLCYQMRMIIIFKTFADASRARHPIRSEPTCHQTIRILRDEQTS